MEPPAWMCAQVTGNNGNLTFLSRHTRVHRPVAPALRPYVPERRTKNPERALDEQIERYRRMTGEQGLALALELHELSCNVTREGIRQQHPDADEAEVERQLRQRLELARS